MLETNGYIAGRRKLLRARTAAPKHEQMVVWIAFLKSWMDTQNSGITKMLYATICHLKVPTFAFVDRYIKKVTIQESEAKLLWNMACTLESMEPNQLTTIYLARLRAHTTLSFSLIFWPRLQAGCLHFQKCRLVRHMPMCDVCILCNRTSK